MSEESAIEESGIFDLAVISKMWKVIQGNDPAEIDRRIDHFHGAYMLVDADLSIREELKLLRNVATHYYNICMLGVAE